MSIQSLPTTTNVPSIASMLWLMIGGYLVDLNIKFEYHIGYHIWYLSNITNYDIQGNIQIIIFQSYEICPFNI
jgi:hypothetical protein